MTAPTRFRPLPVLGVRKTIRDAVEVTLDPGGLTWEPGQYLSFRRVIDGTELRRSYSICTPPGGTLAVGIKKVAGGAFSTWANEALGPGDVLEAMAPQGRFWAGADRGGHYLMFAGGSGITPVLGVMRHVLETDGHARVTLVYANQRVGTIMFRDEIEDLKSEHLGRVSVIHVLEHDAQEIDLFTGRVTPEKCAELFRRWIELRSVSRAYICGPEPMMLGISAALRDHGMPKDRIRFELFSAAQPGRLPQRAAALAEAVGAVPLSITLDGATYALEMAPGQTVLEAAEAAGIDAPFSCRAGVCSTCRCRVLSGEVEMAANHAIEDDELRDGYALSCQSYPVKGPLRVSYDLGH
jgi:ring-1,2-phenylacetyl-CoA epoxidase subunit PaaE